MSYITVFYVIELQDNLSQLVYEGIREISEENASPQLLGWVSIWLVENERCKLIGGQVQRRSMGKTSQVLTFV